MICRSFSYDDCGCAAYLPGWDTRGTLVSSLGGTRLESPA